jgi:hypothetical protein
MMQRASRILPALLVIAALVASACGGPGPKPTAPAGLGPAGVCDLVPDLDGILGRTAVASPSGFTTGGHDRCLWVYQANPSRSVGLTVGPRASHDKTVAAFGDGEAVPGLGEDARWWPGSRTLSVAAGERSFQIDLQLDEPDAAELANRVAERVLARLP